MVSLSILRNFLYPSPYACFWETLSPLNKGEEETMMDFWQFRKHNPEFNFSLKQKRVQKGLAQKELGSKPETVSFIWWSIYLIFSTNFGKIGVITDSENMLLCKFVHCDKVLVRERHFIVRTKRILRHWIYKKKIEARCCLNVHFSVA